MGRSLPRVAMVLLGAVLLGTLGLAVGSWYGGRGTTPLSPDQPRRMAAELLPEAESTGALVHGYRYGVFLAADDFGARRADISYGHPADCALSDQLRRNAAAGGWQGLRRVPGDPCDGWRAEKDGLTATLTHRATTGSTLRIAPAAPAGFLAATVAGTLLGAAAGAALYWQVARRRPPVRRLIGTVVTVALLPGVALTWMDLAANRLAEPVWPIWRSLAFLLVPVCLVLLSAAWIVLTRPPTPAGPATDATAAGREPAIR